MSLAVKANGMNTCKTDSTSDDREKRMREAAIAEAERMNAVEGNMVGYDCPKCKNKGYIAGVKGLYMVTVPCECMKIRANMARLERSGLKDSVAEYTFKNYKADKPWQKGILERAVEFAKDPKGWFYIGGQVGSGKTHICTAIASHLIKKGREVLYMRWTDDTVKLKAVKNNDEEYGAMIEKFKRTDVLYIDDFFKTEKGKQPTTADVNIAFEMLNYRYNNRDLITIISSERTLGELLDIDEATGSRIKQRCGNNHISVERKPENNYRLRG